jgi:hypothetical protein
MPPEARSFGARADLARIAAALLLAAALLTGGCTPGFLAPAPPPPPPPVIHRNAASSEALAADVAVLRKLIESPPQVQMQMVGTAEEDVQNTPTPSRKLRLALILGTPNQAGSDLPRAQQMLRDLAADPHPSLLPGEQALVALELQQIGDYLTLERENRTLQADAARVQQLTALNRRLDGVAEENVSLRKQLGEARAKLAAIANIEKSLNERKPGRPK